MPNTAFAGAWVQKENGGIFLSQYRQYYTNEFYDEDGHKYSDYAFLKSEYNPYGEYGVNNWLTLGGSANIQAIYNDDTVAANRTDLSLNNIEVFVRTPIYQDGGFVSSIEPRLYFPVKSSLTLNPDGNRIMPELKLNFGYGFEDRSYLDSAISYRLRNEGNLDSMFKGELTFGYRLNDQMTVLTQLTREQTDGEITSNDFGNYDLTKLQLSAVWHKYKRVSYQLGVSYDIDGKNTGSGVGLIYSVGYKF